MPDTTIAVRRTLTVAAPPERAFRVFTEGLGTWWPLQPQPDPSATSEVDVRFLAVDGGRTLVELEHRGLETYMERAAEMRGVFGSDDGWGGLLGHFARVAEEG